MKKNLIKLMLSSMLFTIFFVNSSQAQNLLTNGNFESITGVTISTTPATALQNFTNTVLPNIVSPWVPINGNGLDVHRRVHRNIGGELDYHIDLNGAGISGVTGLRQNVTLSAGVNYRLSFISSVHPSLSINTSAAASVTIISGVNTALSQSFTETDNNLSDMVSNGWTAMNYTFTPPVSGSYEVTFNGLGSPHANGGVLIDSVVLAPVNPCGETLILDSLDCNTASYRVTTNNVDIKSAIWTIDGVVVSTGLGGVDDTLTSVLGVGDHVICVHYFGESKVVPGHICCEEICDTINIKGQTIDTCTFIHSCPGAVVVNLEAIFNANSCCKDSLLTVHNWFYKSNDGSIVEHIQNPNFYTIDSVKLANGRVEKISMSADSCIQCITIIEFDLQGPIPMIQQNGEEQGNRDNPVNQHMKLGGELKFVPNPASDKVDVIISGIDDDKALEASTTDSSPWRLTLFTLEGKALYQTIMQVGENKVTIDVSWLPNSQYYIQCEKGSKVIQSKFIKMD